MKMSVAAVSAAVLLQGTAVSASKRSLRRAKGSFLRASPLTEAMAQTLLSSTYAPDVPLRGSRLDEEHCQEPDDPEYEINPYSGSFGPEKISCCRTAKVVIKNLEKRCQDCHDAVPCTMDMEEKWCPEYLARYKKMRDDLCRPMEYPPTTTSEPASKKEKAAAEEESSSKKKNKKDEEGKGKKGDGSAEEAEASGKDGGEAEKEQKKGESEKKGDAENSKGKSEEEAEEEKKKGKKGPPPPKGGQTIATADDEKKEEAKGEEAKAAEKDKAADKHLAFCVKMCVEVAQTEECKDEAACEKFCKEAEPKFAKMKKSD